jgi:nicotinamidase-related amidase
MLLRANDSILIVVDMQARLVPAVAQSEEVTGRVAFMLQVARRLDVPVILTEQYPAGLGGTVEAVRAQAPDSPIVEKTSFSAMREPDFARRLSALRRRQAVVCGAETHVCVLQTAAETATTGFDTFVVADACGSRRDSDKRAGLERLARHGIEAVTSEMVAFEWLHRAGTDAFRDVIKLIK